MTSFEQKAWHPIFCTKKETEQPLVIIAGRLAGKESAYNAGDLHLIPGSGRSAGKGHGNPLQYSSLENPMDRGAWRATVHRVTIPPSSLPNSVNLFGCSGLWQTLRELIIG